jgi:hypothetical protein
MHTITLLTIAAHLASHPPCEARDCGFTYRSALVH